MQARHPHQPEAGRLIRAHRDAHGLGVQDFCDLVSRQSTKYGRVNLDRVGLWRIENQGVVPLQPRRYAISAVLSLLTDTHVTPGAIWDFPGARLATALATNPKAYA